MEELIKKLNEVKELLKDMNVINCTVKKDEIDVLVCKLADVPNIEGTVYKFRGTDKGLPYEKGVVVDGVYINTYGDVNEMKREFVGTNDAETEVA